MTLGNWSQAHIIDTDLIQLFPGPSLRRIVVIDRAITARALLWINDVAGKEYKRILASLFFFGGIPLQTSASTRHFYRHSCLWRILRKSRKLLGKSELHVLFLWYDLVSTRSFLGVKDGFDLDCAIVDFRHFRVFIEVLAWWVQENSWFYQQLFVWIYSKLCFGVTMVLLFRSRASKII